MSSGDAAPTTPFRPAVVGRDEELTRLSDLADAAVEHGAQMVLLSGDAGIGKSTLTAHFLEQLGRGGWGVHVGHCIEYADRPLPFGPIVAVLRSLLLDDLERVDHLVGHHRDDLTGLVPELGGESAGTASLAGDVDRLFDAIASVLTRASEGRPIAFLVEDVHWSDAATRDLLTSLVHNLRGARVLMLITERTGALEKGNAVRTWLAEQRRFPTVHSIELEGLAEDELAAQVTSLTGEDADSAFVSELLERTGGNPYFAHELVVAHGQTRGELPTSLREFIISRLQRLGDDEREVLRAVAIAGGALEHPVLAAMVGEVEVRAVIRALFDGGIVQVDGSLYRLSHALLREAILEDVLPFEAQELHRAAAEALEGTIGARPEMTEAVSLALHWSRADEAEKSAFAAVRAGEAAAKVAAFETAASMAVQALDAWEVLPALDEVLGRSRVDVLANAAEWLASCYRGEEAAELLTVALASWLADAPAEDRASVLATAVPIVYNAGDPDRAADLLGEANALIGSEVSPVAAQVHYRTARQAVADGYIEPALVAAQKAIDIAAQVGPEDVLIDSMSTKALGVGVMGDLEGAITLAREARNRGKPLGLVAIVARAHRNEMLVINHLEGRTKRCFEALTAGLEYAEVHCGPRWQTEFRLDLALGYLEAGRFDDAQPLLEALLASVLDDLRLLQVLHCSAGHALGVGDLESAKTRLSAADEIAGRYQSAQETGVQLRLTAEVARREGRLEDARSDTDRALRLQLASDNVTYTRETLVEKSRIARAMADAGHPSTDEVTREVEVAMRDLKDDGPATQAMIAVVRAELEVAKAGAEVDARCREAIELAEAAGFDYEAAQTRLLVVESALRRPDRALPVEEELTAILDAAADHGMRWLHERTTSYAAGLGLAHLTSEALPAPSAPTELPHFLTQREVEVMSLLAEGLTNKAIGERLFVSPRTVSTHVSNILAKVGLSTRGEAAAAYLRLGLDQVIDLRMPAEQLDGHPG